MYKGKVLALILFVLTLASCRHVIAQVDLCPLEDEAFCAFTQEVGDNLKAGNIDDFISQFELHDCAKYGGGPYGPAEEGFCGTDEWCIWGGPLAGEGMCTPLSQAKDEWERFLRQPVFVKGLVYTLLPGYEPQRTFNLDWPGIILETYDPEWNVILLTSNESGEWIITTFLLQRKDNACVQVPPGTVIPWQWPYEDNVFYWYGMTIPIDEWRAGSGTSDPESYGVLENRSMGGCRFRLMWDMYSHKNSLSTELGFSIEDRDSESLHVTIYTAEDETMSPRIAYFDVIDRTGFQAYDMFRMAYLLVEADSNIGDCSEAVYEVLLTVLPSRFPELKIPQG